MIMEQLLLIGTPELLVIAVIVLLLFGGKKIPELMRSLGLGVKNFKEGMKDGQKDDPSDKGIMQSEQKNLRVSDKSDIHNKFDGIEDKDK